MKDNNDNLVIIFNGEIYNFVELRNDLKDFINLKLLQTLKYPCHIYKI